MRRGDEESKRSLQMPVRVWDTLKELALAEHMTMREWIIRRIVEEGEKSSADRR